MLCTLDSDGNKKTSVPVKKWVKIMGEGYYMDLRDIHVSITKINDAKIYQLIYCYSFSVSSTNLCPNDEIKLTFLLHVIPCHFYI